MSGKTIIRLTSFLLCLLTLPNPVNADYWTQKANYPGNGRSRTFCFSIEDKGYFGCGDYFGYASDFWQYDTTSNTWTQKASFGGGGRWSGVSFSVAGKGYAGLGWGAVMMSDIWKYDPVADTWTQMNNFPAGQRQVPASFTIGSKEYIATGRNFMNIFQTDLWEYDPSIDAWTQKANLPGIARSQPFAFAIDTLGYVGGGFDQSLNGLNDFYEYDPSTNAWAARASLPTTGRGDPAGFSIGCRGYAGTGQTLPVNNVLNDWWEFNPATNLWTAKTNFGGSARDEAAFFSIGGKGYLGLGGINGGSLNNDFWEYTPDTTCITTLPVAIFTAPNNICPGTCTGFTNLSTNGLSFLWTFSGATPSTSTDVNPTNICYNTPGNYPVTLIATNAFSSDTLTLNNFMTVYPHPAPQGITQAGDTLFAYAGATSYQWYHNGLLIPGATDYFYIISDGGNYNVVATDLNGCEVEAVIFDVVGLTAVDERSGIVVYPNPVTDQFDIRNWKRTEKSTLSIYNLRGEIILKDSYLPNNLSVIKVDASRFADGVYLLELNSAVKIIRMKILKHSK